MLFRFFRLFGFISVAWVAGCASPAIRFDAIATELQFSSQTVDGQNFRHRVFVNRAANRLAETQTLHVYLDGDGTPWRQNLPTDDPTSRNPMVLRMMARDPAPSILLGRPCYHGMIAPACDRRFWTSHRYSKEVVNSMTAAIRQWLANYPETKLVLIGFSGGGVLATLILPELPQAQALVTVAANLDVSAWSEIHGYLPLSDSLNPMDQPKLRPNVRQLHLAGSDDNNVPPALIKAFADKQDGARYVEYHQQHHCCWETIWPEPLRFID